MTNFMNTIIRGTIDYVEAKLGEYIKSIEGDNVIEDGNKYILLHDFVFKIREDLEKHIK